MIIDITTGQPATVYTPPEDRLEVTPRWDLTHAHPTLGDFLIVHPEGRGMGISDALIAVNHDEDRLLGPERGV